MIYKHKVSGLLYRHLLTVWNADTQAPNEVYTCLMTGRIYTRRSGDFAGKFELVDSDPQATIKPKPLPAGHGG